MRAGRYRLEAVRRLEDEERVDRLVPDRERERELVARRRGVALRSLLAPSRPSLRPTVSTFRKVSFSSERFFSSSVTTFFSPSARASATSPVYAAIS
jgi:hypothetical protein